MKKITLLIFAVLIIISSKAQKVDYEYLRLKFKEKTENIKMLQYDVRNQITFSNGTVWDNTGFALIEKNQNDTIFGFSFYGIRHDINKSAIYREGIGFNISNELKKYEQEQVGLHFLGRPGGQMVYKDFFQLDKNHKNVEANETDSCYVIKYELEDKPNSYTNFKKVLELNKKTFLPQKVTTSLQPDFGEKQTTVYQFFNLKTNNNIDKTLDEYIKQLSEFEQIKEKKPEPNKLLNKKLPSISLKNLLDENETIEVKTDQITLIDFWEVWCGHCIVSFPKVENLKNKFSSNLNVIGIVSKDKENAIKLVEQKGITFLNLLGNKELAKVFSVNSWPRYFLVDRRGIIQKEYFGFSEQIEQDIQKLIAK